MQLANLANRIRRPGPVAALAFLLLAPFVVAGAWLYAHRHFAPLFDLAMTELRVRDVGTTHTPLIGLPGRLGRDGAASHPGPLSFYLLSPVYRLLGGSYWALRVAGLALHGAAIVTSLAIARRRAGVRGAIGVGAIVAVLELGFGLLLFTEPWNPNLPVPWFLVFLLSVWSVAADDPWLLPVAAFAGSFCAQTHIPYLAVCGGLTPFALLAHATSLRRARRRGSPVKPYSRSVAVALIVVIALWIPPVIDEIIGHPGNLSALFDFFSRPPAEMVGLAWAFRLVVAHLDVWHLVVDTAADPGVLSRAALHVRHPSFERGLVVLLLWAVSAFMGRRRGGRELASLNSVLGAALGVEILAVSRIIGAPWNYLLFSCWVVGALLALAAVWGLLAASPAHRVSAAYASYIGLPVILLGSIRITSTVTGAGSSTPAPSAQLADLTSQATAAMCGEGRKTPMGTYLLIWRDPLYGGAQGIGFLDELERCGLRVLAAPEYATLVTPRRTGVVKDATSLVFLAAGDWIADARRIGGVRQVAYSDQRDASARKEFNESRSMLASALERLGRPDVAAQLGRHLSEAALVEGLHPLFKLTLGRMIDIGMPAAVFVVPLYSGPRTSAAPAKVLPH